MSKWALMTGSGMEINLSKNRFTIVVKRKSATWHLVTRYKPNLLKVHVVCKESSILGIRSEDFARFELLNLRPTQPIIILQEKAAIFQS